MELEHVFQMEKALIGHVIDNQEGAAKYLPVLSPNHVHPQLRVIVEALHTACAERRWVSAELLMEDMRRRGVLRSDISSAIADCVTHGTVVIDPIPYVRALRDIYLARDISVVGTRVQQMSATSAPSDILAYMASEVAALSGGFDHDEESRSLTLTDILAMPEPDDSDMWLVPGLIPVSDRLLITSGEGSGKSHALRQIALATALGFHPFDMIPQEPRRVLMVDCENSTRQVVKSLRDMYRYASTLGGSGSPDNLTVESRQQGIDLCEPSDQGWLLGMVRRTTPSLLVLGPMYRMAGGDINDESNVRCWQRVLEPLLEMGISIVMEHHAPNEQGGGQRSLRPIGSSVIRRWFSQGIGLRPTGCETHGNPYCSVCGRKLRVEAWRGSRDETKWPACLASIPGTCWYAEDTPK